MRINMENNTILYSTPDCPMCKLLISMLDTKKIKYIKIMDTNVMQKLNINHVPVLSYNNKKMNMGEAIKFINTIQ